MKKCYVCKTEKSLDSFSKNGNRGDGYYPMCKPCKNTTAKAHREKDPVKHARLRKAEYERRKLSIRDYQLKKTYGIDLDEYNALLKQQNNVCAICKKQSFKRNGKVTALATDHCHVTGKVRGLLCGECNKGLGRFKDNTQHLTAAVAYLQKNQNQGIKSP